MRIAFWALGSAAVVVLAIIFWPRAGAQVCLFDEVAQAPSGRMLTLCDILYEDQPDTSIWAVVRVLDPEFQGITEGAALSGSGEADHDWVCDHWGLGALAKEPRPTRIVVQIMAEPFPRGEPTPGVPQAIEVYSEANGLCQWELL